MEITSSGKDSEDLYLVGDLDYPYSVLGLMAERLGHTKSIDPKLIDRLGASLFDNTRTGGIVSDDSVSVQDEMAKLVVDGEDEDTMSQSQCSILLTKTRDDTAYRNLRPFLVKGSTFCYVQKDLDPCFKIFELDDEHKKWSYDFRYESMNIFHGERTARQIVSWNSAKSIADLQPSVSSSSTDSTNHPTEIDGEFIDFHTMAMLIL